jgi:hypothetical protein
MEIASTVIKDILQEVQVQASEQPVEAADSNTVIRYMNRFMTSLDVKGVSLGYTKINNPSDPVTIPDAALEGLIFNVAKRILNTYDIPLNAELQEAAKDGLDAMFTLGVVIDTTAYPSTLPIGSGNEDDYTFGNQHFYPGIDDENIATEDNKVIGLE